MKVFIKSEIFRWSVLFFTVIPLLILTMNTLPERSLLQESLSIITVLAFFQMTGQFFWVATNRGVVKGLPMSKVVTYHKIIGYIFVALLLVHPLILIVPRFFESGVAPVDAFATIITTFNQGIVLGMTAWCLLLVLGLTSLARKKLPMKYTTWRVFHGLLAMLFLAVGTWHVIDLGRHANPAMSAFITILSAVGILLLLQTYFIKKSKKQGGINEYI